MRSFFDRIGSRDAINWVSILAVSITQTMCSMVASDVNYAGRIQLFVACNLTAIASMALGLGVGTLVMRRTAEQKSRPLIAISILLIANFIRSNIFDSLLVRFNFAVESQLAYRFFSSTLATAAIYLLLAYTVANAREIHRNNQKLILVTNELRDAKESSINDLEIYRHTLLVEIRNRIYSALSQVKIHRSDQHQILEGIIDEVIRPTSYQLYKNELATGEIIEATISAKIAWKDVANQLVTNKPYQTFIVPALIAMTAELFLIPVFSAPSFSQVFLIVTFAFCLLTFANMIWDRNIQHLNVNRRLFLYCLITFIFTIITSSAMASMLPESIYAPTTHISLLAGALTITVLPAFVAASARLQEILNSSLSESNSALQSELASLNLLKFQFRKNAARLIHGQIQDIVSAAVMRLAKASSELTLNDVHELKRDIENAWEEMNKSHSETESLNDYLQGLVEMWDVQAEIILNFDLYEVEIISRDRNSAMAVRELVREACSNSIRHGKATTIYVSMHLNREISSVSLTVSDNGIGFEVGSKAGLGTQMFDDFTTSWTITSNVENTSVTAEIPYKVLATR